jgi:N-acetylglutamate synthase-like GNAT family acetyltransferase
MGHAIRPYAEGDLHACRGLWEELTEHHREIYGDPTIDGPDPGRQFDDHLARLGPGRIWVAEDNGVVCGLVGLVASPGDEEAEIEPVIVTRSRRDGGVGTELLAAATGEARRLGVRFLNIRPVARNAGAISLFARAGFRLVGRVELFQELAPSDRSWSASFNLDGRALNC